MPPIRSLLWIGPGRDLVRLEITETATLDVIWVDGPDAFRSLPPLAVDAAVIGSLATDEVVDLLSRWPADRVRAPVLVLTEGVDAARDDRLRRAGAHGTCPLSPGQGDPPDAAARFRHSLEVLLRSDHGLSARRPSRARAPRAHAGPALVGTSPALRRVEESIASAAAACRATVLVQGETGSGKEIAARRIHAQSARHAAPFVAVNCAAFADSLLASELFGHRRGAFTGAERDRIGLFERAQGGTLFLDEVGETSPALQASLLRVLQEHEVLPVGGDRPKPVDVRVVAATHRDLGAEIEAGRFREDLYYRLAVLRVDLPPLRERPGDVRVLSEHFLAKLGERAGAPGCQLSPRAMRLLERHGWPGNVRELENEIQRLLALAEPGELVTARRLSPALRHEPEHRVPVHADRAPSCRLHDTESLAQAMERIEADLIRDALLAQNGRKARTARRLGVTREGLYKKLKRLGIG